MLDNVENKRRSRKGNYVVTTLPMWQGARRVGTRGNG